MRAAATTRILSLTTSVVLGLAACGGEGDGQETATSSPRPVAARPSSTASLGIVEPPVGAVVDGDIVQVRLELTGAKIIKNVSVNLRPDEGHIHLRLDGETITILGGLEEKLAELTGRPLTPGPHLLEAEFVAADHGPFNPRIIASVPFRAQ